MKIIYLVPAVPVAMEVLEAVLVGEDAVRVDSGADIARCGAGAEVFIVSGNLYGADEAKALKDTARGLKFVQTRSVGLDPFLRHGFPEGVIVCNARGVRGTTCAEHAVALLLGLARRIPRMERNRIAGDWGRDGLVDDVMSLEGRSVAVVGYGSIGRQVARRLKAFDMHVIAVSRDGATDAYADEGVPVARLRDILPRLDAVILSVPLTRETRHLLGEAEFALMKPSALIVNVARGGVIDQTALLRALDAGVVAGAGLDVQEQEPVPTDDLLWHSDKLIVSPHVAGWGGPAHARFAQLVADNLKRYRDGEPLINRVDMGQFAE